MGFLLLNLGKYDEAESNLTEALDGYRRVLGDEHPSTLTVTFMYANLLHKLNRLSEALEFAELFFNGSSNILGSSHERTLGSIDLVIAIHDALHAQDPTAGHDFNAQAWRDEKARRLASVEAHELESSEQ
jgi:hypothetical protein